MAGEASRINTDFYITYHHSDEMAARWIAAELKQARFTTLSDSWDFLRGETPLEKIDSMFGVSRFVMVLISEKFLQAMGDLMVETLHATSLLNSVFFVRIDSCEIEKVLGSAAYLDLAGKNEKEAVETLRVTSLRMAAVGAAAPDKKETAPLPVSARTSAELLAKRKQEFDQLLVSTIKHNFHMKLDLEHEVEKEVEVKNEKNGEMEKRKEWVWEPVPLETVLEDRKNYILVNPSGMGKTTFLTYAASTLLDRDALYPFRPLLFTCIGLNNRDGSIENFILHQVESFYTHSQGSLVSGEWENLCVLIDALDQARDVDDIVSSLLLHDKPLHYKKAKIILSSRQNTADKVKEGFEKIRLKLPVADEIQLYLGEENYKKLEGIIESSGELVTAPVLLEMLKTITEKGHIVSTLFNRAGLYTEFTKILLDQERSKTRFWQDPLSINHFIYNELEQALEKIAFFSLVDNQILEIPKEKLAQYCESPAKKEALLNIGIILEFFEDREQKIVFRHQSFQAYFAARYIFNQQPELFRELVGDIAFFYDDLWYEVMRFYVSLEKALQKAEAIIDTIYRSGDKKIDLNQALRLIFAFYLMSEARVSLEFVKRVYTQLGDLLKYNQQYWDIFNSNSEKFNKGNNEQRRLIFIIFEPLLRDENKDVCRASAEMLGKIGTSEHIPLLRPLLRTNFFDLFLAATKALEEICTSEHITFLEPLLRDEDGDVRGTAARALGNIGTSEHIPLLKSLLEDKAENVRGAAAEVLGKIGTAKDIHLLAPLLRDEDKHVRKDAADALVNIVKTGDIPLLEPLLRDENEYVRCVATEALGKIGTKKNIPLLKPLLKDLYWRIRRAAAEMLGKIGTEKDIPLLKSLIKDKFGDVRFTAAETFGKIGTAKYIPLIEPLLRDDYSDVRIAAIIAVGKIGVAKNIPLVNPLLRDNNKEVRNAAAEALRNIVTSSDIALLEPLLRDKECFVRWAAANALLKIVTAKDISLIAPLLRNESEYVCKAAAEALGKIGSSKNIPLLEPLLRDENKHVRCAAAKALEKIGTSEHIPLLEPLLSDKDVMVRSATAFALGEIGTSDHVPLLEPLLKDEYYYVRSTATEVLGKIGTSPHIPLLEPLLRDEEELVRHAANKALKKIVTGKHIPLLKPLLRDENEYVRGAAARALGDIGTSNDVTLLEPLLRDRSEDVRCAVAQALKKIGTSEHIPLLEPLLRDENEYVRHAAAFALGEIGTSKDVTLLDPLLREESYIIADVYRAAFEDIEKMCKRSTPKLCLDRVLPQKKE